MDGDRLVACKLLKETRDANRAEAAVAAAAAAAEAEKKAAEAQAEEPSADSEEPGENPSSSSLGGGEEETPSVPFVPSWVRWRNVRYDDGPAAKLAPFGPEDGAWGVLAPRRGVLRFDYAAPFVDRRDALGEWTDWRARLKPDETDALVDRIADAGAAGPAYAARGGAGGDVVGDVRLALAGRTMTCEDAARLVDASDLSERRVEIAVSVRGLCVDADERWVDVLDVMRGLEQSRTCARLGAFPKVDVSRDAAVAKRLAETDRESEKEKEEGADGGADGDGAEGGGAEGGGAEGDGAEGGADGDGAEEGAEAGVETSEAAGETENADASDPSASSPPPPDDASDAELDLSDLDVGAPRLRALSMHYRLECADPEHLAALRSACDAAAETPWRAFRNLRVCGVRIDASVTPRAPPRTRCSTRFRRGRVEPFRRRLARNRLERFRRGV